MPNQNINVLEKNCTYLNVFYCSLENQTVPVDILTDARSRFFISGGKKTKDKLSFTYNGISYSYFYQIQTNSKTKWKATANGVTAEELVLDPSGYGIIYKNQKGFIVKRMFFNHSHIWQKTEYFKNGSSEPTVSLMPWLNDDRAAIALYDGEVSFPQILFALEISDNTYLNDEAVAKCRPLVKATVNGRTYYFGDEEVQARWNLIINGTKSNKKESQTNKNNYFNIDNLTKNVKYKNLAASATVLNINSVSPKVKYAAPADKKTASQQAANSASVDNASSADALNDDNSTAYRKAISNVLKPAADTYSEITSSKANVGTNKGTDVGAAESNSSNAKPEDIMDAPAMQDVDVCKNPGNEADNADKQISLSQKEKGYYFGELDSLKRRSGYGRTATAKGRTLYEGEYSEDMKNGFGVSYFKTGKLAHIGNYKNNNYDGFGLEFRATDGCITAANFENNTKKYVSAKFDKLGHLLYARGSSEKNGAGVTFNLENGEMFIPKVENGTPLNFGTVISADGVLIYSGDYKNGSKEGAGTLFNSDGTVKYTGSFKKNIYNGNGTFYYDNGSTYTGEFANGVPNGTGVLKNSAGDVVYKGQWKNGMYNGDGSLYDKNGSYCAGKFVNGEAKGTLSIYDKNGVIIYSGTILNGKPNGSGICYSNGVKVYDGQLSDGIKSGTGRLYSNDECVYMGSFENDMFNGFGISYKHTNEEYCGMWQDGKYNGAGILNIDKNTFMAGNFKDGIPDGRVNIIKNNVLINECFYNGGECVYMHEYSEDGTSIIYDGNVKNNHREGMGCIFSDYGEKKFEGIFKKGEPYKSMKVSLRELQPLEYVAKLKDTKYEKFRHYKEFVVEQPMLGGVFSGQLNNGKPDGKGTILYADHRYTGNYKNGLPCGKGTIYFGDGTVVTGTFTDQVLENTKAIKFANAVYYLLEN